MSRTRTAGRVLAPIVGLVLTAALVAAPVRAQGSAPAGQPARTEIEQRLRQRLGAIVRRELGLNDEQARQLGEVNGRYERERRQLAMRERDVRLKLRDELQGGESANQERVGRALDRMLEIQRTRVEILQREQGELAKFLTPVQRARYLVLQDQLRRRLEEARREQEAGAPRAGRLRRPGVRP